MKEASKSNIQDLGKVMGLPAKCYQVKPKEDWSLKKWNIYCLNKFEEFEFTYKPNLKEYEVF